MATKKQKRNLVIVVLAAVALWFFRTPLMAKLNSLKAMAAKK